ncbi:MAG: hypothetical protein F7C34_00830 [Desulfurococcales archaeon]|nr:hypothetical protein [Desulfurococcales archaeon]
MGARARVKLCLGEYSAHVYRALIAEKNQPAPEKGAVDVYIEDGCLLIAVYSGTLSGLRALLNSFLLLAHASYSSLMALEG